MVARDGFHAGLVFFRARAVANVTMKTLIGSPLTGREISQIRHFGGALIAAADGCAGLRETLRRPRA
jgi:hypothetical protein